MTKGGSDSLSAEPSNYYDRDEARTKLSLSRFLMGLLRRIRRH